MMPSAPTIRDFATVVSAPGLTCPSCAQAGARTFYEVLGIPTHNVKLMYQREQALNCSKGDLRLAFCSGCGFIWNSAFEPERVTYDDDYESTQAFSPTFNAFHERLAEQLVGRYDLVGKEVYEIGCGQGEFLTLLARKGVGRAVGFDPTLRPDARAPDGVTLIRDWYSEDYADHAPDFVASKMTMEHIPDPGRFLAMLRRTMGNRPDAVAFAMLPETRRVFEVCGFWDIYYEHCAYFTPGSLARAFRLAGFDVFDLETAFGDHYCMLAARPGNGRGTPLPDEETPEQMAGIIDRFVVEAARRRQRWTSWLRHEKSQGRRTVLWGGGSKGVAFLTTLKIGDEIDFAVDINPRRRGTFMAGTGQAIDTPERLERDRPDNVVVMSPVYTDEIRADLRARELDPVILSIEDVPGAAG